MKIITLIFLIATFALYDVNCLRCYDCGSPQLSDCLRRTSECLGVNSTCADLRIRDKIRSTHYIAKGCAPVDICATIEQNSSISCSQCSEDLCNDIPATNPKTIRTVRAASGWWSNLKAPLKDSAATQTTTSPLPVEMSTKQKRDVGSWLDAGSEILRFVNNHFEREAAVAQAEAEAQARALSSSGRLYLSSFILFLGILKFIF